MTSREVLRSSDALRCIHERKCADGMRFFAQLGHGINCAQRIRDVCKREQLHLRRGLERWARHQSASPSGPCVQAIRH